MPILGRTNYPMSLIAPKKTGDRKWRDPTHSPNHPVPSGFCGSNPDFLLAELLNLHVCWPKFPFMLAMPTL